MEIDLEKFRKKAITIIKEKQLENNKQKVVAFLLDRKGNTIFTGWNQYDKTHPIQKEWACRLGMPEREFIHAEMACIIKAKNYGHTLNSNTLLILRLNGKGQLLPSKPCKICNEAIKYEGIENVIHT